MGKGKRNRELRKHARATAIREGFPGRSKALSRWMRRNLKDAKEAS